MTQVCDFSRSFVTWQLDLDVKPPRTITHRPNWTVNNARVQLECVCTVRDAAAGRTQRFVLGASCKTERVNVERDIWVQPNADFSPVFSQEHVLTIKNWGAVGRQAVHYPPAQGLQPERQIEKLDDAFTACEIHVAQAPARSLATTREIIEATRRQRPLVARTEYRTAAGCDVLVEYPVKTINISERHGYFQTDTGPVLFLDPAEAPDLWIEGLQLAFIAHNAPEWAELILNVPTPVHDAVSIHHYSRPVRIDCHNTVLEHLEGSES